MSYVDDEGLFIRVCALFFPPLILLQNLWSFLRLLDKVCHHLEGAIFLPCCIAAQLVMQSGHSRRCICAGRHSPPPKKEKKTGTCSQFKGKPHLHVLTLDLA